MEVKCKVCRFKFDISFDDTQTEMVTYCPRCGTPQVVFEHQKNISIKTSTIEKTEITTATHANDKSNAYVEKLKKEISQKEVNSIDKVPTPRASLDVVAYKPSIKNQGGWFAKFIFALIIFAIICIIAFCGYEYYKQQQIDIAKDNHTMEMFGGTNK